MNTYRLLLASLTALLALSAGIGSLANMGSLSAGATVAEAARSRSVSATVSGQALKIKGTNADDLVTLRLNARDAGVLEIDAGDDGSADFAFERAAFAAIKISVRGGDDVVRIDEANGPIVEPTSIRGGNGDDTILGGSAAETIAGGPGDDFIDGNRANDVAFMGAGKDTFRWDPGDASDVVEGEDGLDTLLFNGANGGETVDVSANGERLTFFRNPGGITMDMDEVETVAFNALGGPDTVTVGELAATDARNVLLSMASGQGGSDGQPDRVVVNGTAGDDAIVIAGTTDNVAVTGLSASVDISSPDANDRLDVITGAGNDTVDASGLAAGVIQLVVDDAPIN